jgi:hypothetical protein
MNDKRKDALLHFILPGTLMLAAFIFIGTRSMDSVRIEASGGEPNADLGFVPGLSSSSGLTTQVGSSLKRDLKNLTNEECASIVSSGVKCELIVGCKVSGSNCLSSNDMSFACEDLNQDSCLLDYGCAWNKEAGTCLVKK